MVSDFLAEMEARRRRVERPAAPTAAVVVVFLAALIAAFVVAAVATETASGFFAGAPEQMDVAGYVFRALGGGALVVLAAAAFLHFAFLAPRRPSWTVPVVAGLTGMVMLVAVGLSLLGGLGLDRSRQEAIAVAEIRRIVDVLSAGDLTVPVGDATPKARGQAGKVEHLFKVVALDFISVGGAYQRDLKALDVDDLTPEQLSRADLNAVKARLVRARERTEAYRRDTKAVYARARKRFDTLGDADPASGPMIDAFAKGFMSRADVVDEMVGLQQEVITLNIEQIEFLRTHRWTAERGMFMFYSERDLRAFQDLGERIARKNDSIIARQDQSQQRMRDVLARMER